jgi:hypothetical protein
MYKEEVHNFQSSLNTTRVIRSRKINLQLLTENLKEKDLLGDLGADGRIIM